MGEIILRARMKLPELFCDEIQQVQNFDSGFSKLDPWVVSVKDLGICVMCILLDDEDEAFTSIYTHKYLRPVPLEVASESFEVRFGYILVSSDRLLVEDGILRFLK